MVKGNTTNTHTYKREGMSFNTKTHHKLKKKKNYPLYTYKLDREKIEQEKYTLKSEMSF